MDLPEFLRFTPVPLRAQHNGWSPERQRRFIIALARGAGPGEAARALGMNRQSAYRLRAKAGAESFAAAWDAAQTFARRVHQAGRPPAGMLAGVQTLLVPRFYRGRLIGFVQREDVRGLIAALGRLDRLSAHFDDAVDKPARGSALEKRRQRRLAPVSTRPSSLLESRDKALDGV